MELLSGLPDPGTGGVARAQKIEGGVDSGAAVACVASQQRAFKATASVDVFCAMASRRPAKSSGLGADWRIAARSASEVAFGS